ncbi:uncharacterized protein LOC111040067 [Myzus persicae]|uniref:uncharacterized protein LOC111040067 n=1 Tax=Myzus persicae TaxID=13164 RepID=UPI000B93510B|nr:uncharacterized protein LOC111040067 [Myzus persicae]
MLPLKLQVSERSAIHVAKQTNSALPLKNELREDSISKWQSDWQNSATGRWTKRLIPDLRPWILRKSGTVNYHITQLLTGHGCYEHAFFLCDRWWRLRRELEVKTEVKFFSETAVYTMLESEEKWDAVC